MDKTAFFSRRSIFPEMNACVAPSLAVASFVALALAYSVVIPLGEASDEVPHFFYIQYLVQHQHLPPPEGRVSGESHQPPLYYLLGAIMTAPIPRAKFHVIANPGFALDNPKTPNLLLHDSREAFPYREDVLAWHIVRLVSIALGAVTIWSTGQIAREIFPGDAAIAFGATAFVAFSPAFLALSAVVNNDNLVIALSALAVWQSVRMWHRGVDVHGAALLGIWLGLSALTKLSGFVLWIYAALIFFLSARKIGNWKELAFPVALCYAIAGAMILPWVIYNLATYGDPVGWSVILATTPVRAEPMTWQEAAGIVQGLFTSFWGRFGGALHLRLASWVYAVLGVSALVGLSGWIGYARDARARRLGAGARTSLILFALFWTVMLIAYLRWSFVVLGADQARQLFPGLPLFAIFFSAGLARAFGAHARIALAVMSVCLLGLNIGTLLYLRAIFGGI